MLKHMRIKGFRCLKDTGLEFAPLTVLIGPNDSGKSSILDSLFVLSRIALDGLDKNPNQWITGRYDLSTLLVKGDPSASRCDYLLLFGNKTDDGSSYEYRMQFAEGNGIFVIEDEYLQLRKKNLIWTEEEKIYIKRGNKIESFSHNAFNKPCKRSLASYERLTAEERNEWFPFRRIAMLGFQTGALARPCPIDLQGPHGLEADGSGLAALLDYYLGAQRDRFDTIEDELRKYSPMVEKVLLKPEEAPTAGGGRTAGKAIYFKLKDGREIHAYHASDGLLLALGFLAVTHSPDPPWMILVEEPENGIHPENLGLVMDLFRRLSDGRLGNHPVQVVMTTHSPYLLDLAEPEEVRVVTRSIDAGTRVASLKKHPGIEKQLREFKLGELWTAIGDEHLGKGAGH